MVRRCNNRSTRTTRASRTARSRSRRGPNAGRRQAEKASLPCNLCESTNVDVLSLKDRNRDYLRTVICKECGLIWTAPRPSAQQVRKFYSCDYRQEYKRVYRPKRKHILRAANESILRYQVLEDILRPGDTVLDVGSGAGVFVYVLCQMGLAGRGVEPHQSYAEYSAEALGVDVTNSFFEDAGDQANSLDAVLLHHVLEHMENPYRALLKASHVLKDGGYLVVGVPNAEDTRQAPYNRYHKAHLFTFNPRTLEAIGRKAGFKIHNRIVGPRNGNMIFTFRREVGSEEAVTGLPGNCERIRGILDRLSTLRYFTTSAPYRTFLDKILGSAREKAALRKLGDEKAIIDTVIEREIRGSRTSAKGVPVAPVIEDADQGTCPAADAA